MKTTKEYVENIESAITETFDAFKVVEDKLKEVDSAFTVLCEKIIKVSKTTYEMKNADTSTTSNNETSNGTTTLKLEDVRKVLAEISRQGKTAEIKALLHKYGAEKLSSIKESDYESLLNEAKEL